MRMGNTGRDKCKQVQKNGSPGKNRGRKTLNNLMTKEQIEQLRALIQCEIDYAMQEESGYKFSYETKAFNDGAWETFKETFK